MPTTPYTPANPEKQRLYEKFATMRATALLGWFGLVCSLLGHWLY